MVMKFRMVKFARIPSYNQLFSGDPVWATLEVAGMGQDGRSMVTKNDYRFLHTLEDMGPALYKYIPEKTDSNLCPNKSSYKLSPGYVPRTAPDDPSALHDTLCLSHYLLRETDKIYPQSF